MSVHINLELTDHCNIKCPMCSQSLRDEAHGAPKRFMSWEVWQASLASLEDMEEEVHLCPHWLGEPTIHPEFDRFVRYAFEQNTDRRLFHEFKLHTNAVIFSEERARMLVELANAPGAHPDCFRFIHFSIDSFSKKSYVLCKGADRRDQVFENVERFLRVRHEMGATTPYAHLAFVVQPANAHEAGDFLAHWRELKREVGGDLEVTWDWPHKSGDTVYFRPLNCADQEASDRLHAQTCREVGLDVPSLDRLRSAESF